MKYFTILLITMFICLIPNVGFNNTDNPNLGKKYKIAVVYSYNIGKLYDPELMVEQTGYVRSLLFNKQIKTWHLNGNNKEDLAKNSKLIFDRINKFEPDIIVSYGGLVMEYMLIPYIYPNTKYDSVFYQIPDYKYDELFKKYNLEQYGNKVTGVTIRNNFKNITEFLKEKSVATQYIYLIQNSDASSNIIQERIRQENPQSSIEIFIANNYNEFGLAVHSIAKKPKGILFVNCPRMSDETGKMSNKRFASLLDKNKKHLEVILNTNLSKYGACISLISFMPSDTRPVMNVTYNSLFKSILYKEKINTNVYHLDNKIIVNSKRLRDLHYLNILEKTEGIDYVY